MTSSERFPQASHDVPEDLTVVHALRTTAHLAARRREDDPVWRQLETEVTRTLRALGVDDQVPDGGIGTGTVDRAQLGPARAELYTSLSALERDPTIERARSALGHLDATGGTAD